MTEARIGAVLIGRNEGERLVRCLASLAGTGVRMVYVDSGSTDDSVTAAQEARAEVVELDMTQPFTAARARNEGLARLMDTNPPEYVQFVDGDCEVQPTWIETARTFLDANPKAAVACGRRRERFPETSIYNWLCDREWDTPVGQAKACGGDALMRTVALQEVDGYNPRIIAGEEPEMCVRLRARGWEIWRLDAEMTLHDAAMTRFSQWWRRTQRGGHAYAEGAALHGAPPERHCVAQTRRALLWGLALPVAALALAIAVSPWGLALLGLYPVQFLRLGRRHGWHQAVFLIVGKFAETRGIVQYWFGRFAGRRAAIIEYK